MLDCFSKCKLNLVTIHSAFYPSCASIYLCPGISGQLLCNIYSYEGMRWADGWDDFLSIYQFDVNHYKYHEAVNAEMHCISSGSK